MQKNTIILVIFLVIGLLLGSILGEILSPYVPFLGVSKAITWSPAADLDILKYDMFFQVKLNLASVIGLLLAFWMYRKL